MKFLQLMKLLNILIIIQINKMTDDLSKYKDIFIIEVQENLHQLDSCLLKLEKNLKNKKNDKELLNELMRLSHSIKGAAATMGYQHLAYLTHIMEDVFDCLRKDKIECTPVIVEKLFETIDTLEESVIELKDSDKEKKNSKIASELKKITGVNTEDMERNTKSKPKKQKSETQKTKTHQTSKKSKKKVNKQIEHIKVAVGRLDSLMDLVEELLITKMHFNDMCKFVMKNVSNKELVQCKVNPLFQKFDRLTTDIQYHVMQARLVPVDQIFSRFPRMVRDLAKKQKKEVEFKISGGDIELDRIIVENLAEPLVHLLRNAIDHGIDKQGTIQLKATRRQDYALISVEDNGKGIDYKKILKIALEKDLIKKDEQQKILDQIPNKTGILPQIFEQILFSSQISTAKKITEISGRGVGLNVIENFLDNVGGKIYVEKLEKGTRFTLQLPLTLAIIKALLINSEKDTYAIPISSIERSIQIRKEEIKKTADQEAIVLDNENIPIIRLNNLFNPDQIKETSKKSEQTVVIVKSERDTVGIVVDKLINEHEIIIKPLSKVLRNIKTFSGATILGNGKTVLILDIPGLINQTFIEKIK